MSTYTTIIKRLPSQALSHLHPTPKPQHTFKLPPNPGLRDRKRPLPKPTYTIPPNHPCTTGHLTTFTLPSTPITGSPSDITLGHQMISTWRTHGIFQIHLPPHQSTTLRTAFKASKSYFSLPHAEKSKHVNDQSFSGYIASGEELTDGIADYSEIYTITKDLPPSDPRVQNRWPCHGPCPWPSSPTSYKSTMNNLLSILSTTGEKLLKLTALGLNLPNPNTFTDLTHDGWHHMRILRFPHLAHTNGKGKAGRGIGSHTDYGLLVLAAQDHVGGLFVRKPDSDSDVVTRRNWEKSTAGHAEHDSKWTFIPPTPNVLTVFPGDMMQYMTNSHLLSTPHKVGLNTAERYAFAYFHEPNFSAVVRPIPQLQDKDGGGEGEGEGIHYGTHFTEMCMRNYPDRITAKRIRAENRLDILPQTRVRVTS